MARYQAYSIKSVIYDELRIRNTNTAQLGYRFGNIGPALANANKGNQIFGPISLF